MSSLHVGRKLSEGGGEAGRAALSPARVRIQRLRQLIRLRRKLRRARRETLGAGDTSRAPRAASLLGLLVLLFAACAGAAWGCGWGGFENSVRFGFSSDRSRVRLPPLPTKPENTVAAEEDEGLTAAQRAAEVDTLWDSARASVASGDLGRARRLLGSYAERTAGALCDAWDAPADCRGRRNSALDLLDALASLDRGSSTADVRSYLEARAAYDDWLAGLKPAPEETPDAGEPTQEQQESGAPQEAERAAGMRAWDEEVETRLAPLERDPNLADNVAYLRAAGIYRAGRPGDALETFESVAARHPRGEKREAAIYMAGRLALESSAAYLGGETATSEDPCREPACRDEGWARARKNFARLLADYPRGRYASDARGWLAYLDYRVGDTAGALAEYYRMLAGPDASGRVEAAKSLRLVRQHADDSDMDAVERALEDEPEAALAYAYHNVYNYAAGYYLRVPEVSEENPYDSDEHSSEHYRWEEQKTEALRERAERAELRRAADFASRMVARHTRAQVGGAFLVRLAGAQLELGRPAQALEAARRALDAAPTGDERARALWLKGVAEHHLKDYAASRVTLARVASEFPRSELARPSRELLAVVAEDAGDLGGALEQYLALGYDPDVAYFVDVLMTPDQLASFVARRGDSAPRQDELLYASGLRFMRAGRYAEARAALTRVHTSADSYNYSSGSYGYFDSSEGERHAKLNFRHTFWDDSDEDDGETAVAASGVDSRGRDTRVYADWLLRDIGTLEDLERLQGEVERARGEEERAEALYQLASYFYERDLLFYNPAAWRGMRAELIGSLGESSYRAPAEAQTVWGYVREHEGAARALDIYLEVARLYPRTRAARDSLYTAILCHQRLSNFNGYWRGMYGQGLHAGAALVTLSDLRRAYPQYRLPLAGNWKPSTRTVGGEAAWPAPTKARPLTRTERARSQIRRAERGVARAWGLFGEVYGGRVRAWTVAAARWTVVACTACVVLLVFRRTRRARRFLYRRLTRRRRSPRPRPAPQTYAPKSSYAAHVTRGASLRAAAGQTARDLLRLALHERGRAALALNLFTHGLLTVLLWAVLWAAR